MQCWEKGKDPGDDGRVGRRAEIAGNWQGWQWGKGGGRDGAGGPSATSRCQGGELLRPRQL